MTRTHQPAVASVGLPFLMVELRDRAALERARARADLLEALAADGISPDVHLYFRSEDEFDLRARMFAPLDGVPEDPATGSANVALGALLARSTRRRAAPSAGGSPRASRWDGRACSRSGGEAGRRGDGGHVAGTSVLVSEGEIEVD